MEASLAGMSGEAAGRRWDEGGGVAGRGEKDSITAKKKDERL